jgi:hypothetical protein
MKERKVKGEEEIKEKAQEVAYEIVNKGGK